jgi:sigma-B regulation protein RsbU (phosphoserine phosphatase)
VRSRTLTFTNAGLIKPVLRSGDAVGWLETDGPKHPLGILSDSNYSERTINLSSGDVLVFVTDGVTEEQNRVREFYGEQRLLDLIRAMDSSGLSARRIKEKVLKDVKEFSGPTIQDDDITVVVVKAV